ncbi:MAG: hypothetical protein IIW87_08345, partial [Alistipes sp.]|nr:hypothetical protein [Alistipes sp.]
MKKIKTIYPLVLLAALLFGIACNERPTATTPTNELPTIFPDYTEVKEIKGYTFDDISNTAKL